VIWATTTPVNETEEYRKIKKFARSQTDVTLYNAAAVRISKELDVPLMIFLPSAGRRFGPNSQKVDGVHFLPEGSARLEKPWPDSSKPYL